jgi:hypothetical protein
VVVADSGVDYIGDSDGVGYYLVYGVLKGQGAIIVPCFLIYHLSVRPVDNDKYRDLF